MNEAVPEWPPSPFRLVRALVDAWYRKHEDIPADVVRRLLEKLSEPPVFLLPCARASHTRSYLAQNSEDPTDKKLIFDGFAVVDRDSRVLVGWPGVQLDPIAVEAARQLFGSLNYLGGSEGAVSPERQCATESDVSSAAAASSAQSSPRSRTGRTMMTMSASNPLPLTDVEKTQMRQWLENWRRVGPLLEAERIAGVRALTDAEAARMACDLWRFALPGGGDDAEGLLPMKLALRKLDPGR